MSIKYDLDGQKKAYARWAPIYDRIYLRLLAASQRRLAAAAAARGARILEVGVGTGLTLPYYPPETRVAGVDLSEHMLRKAAEKVSTGDLRHVRLLAAMDACRLGFPDASFDAVTLPFVITLVPDPERALDECARVLRPGGEIVIASRFGAEGGLQARFERLIAPLARAVGWSTSFTVGRVDAWAKRRGGLRIVDVRPGFYFKVVRLAKDA